MVKIDDQSKIAAWYNDWDNIVKAVGKDKCRRVERYAIKKEKDWQPPAEQN